MTVQELIDKLKELPPDKEVYVADSDGHYTYKASEVDEGDYKVFIL